MHDVSGRSHSGSSCPGEKGSWLFQQAHLLFSAPSDTSALAFPLTLTVPSGIQDLSTQRSILFMMRSSRRSTAWLTFCPFAALVSKYWILCRSRSWWGARGTFQHGTNSKLTKDLQNPKDRQKAGFLFSGIVFKPSLYCKSLSWCSKGVSSSISCPWRQIFARWRRADIFMQTLTNMQPLPSWQTLEADESPHTRTSLPGCELLLRSLLSDPPGHTCFHTGWRPDYHNTREPAADLRDGDWFSGETI